MTKKLHLRIGGLVAALACMPLSAKENGMQYASLADMTLEQLSDVIVTSVSRREERLSDAAASIFVISAEDIRHSGATSLPEALRLAPSLQVARTDAHQYAITARGFNSTTANKLLVLIDGRTVYTPLYSGVFWDAQQVMLEDVERIEVINGPGGTLWGANAVNGVINIITRAARDTQDTLVVAGAGNREKSVAVRSGGTFQSGGHYRVYAQAFDRDNTERADGSAVRDDGQTGQIGFRADLGSEAERITLQGDAYRGRIDLVPEKRTLSGANVLARWDRHLQDGSALHLQAYLDHTERDQPTVFHEKLDILDLEFNHALQSLGSHKLLWGGGYRHARDRVTNSPVLAFLPAERTLNWGNLFIQDEIDLRPDLSVTAGLKAERNPYTGVEYLPNLRLAWRPSPQSLVWGALSRAIRAPARIDREFFVPGNAPYAIAGGPNFRSEIANVIEAGYRSQPSRRFSYSVNVFRHEFSRLRSVEQVPTGDELENRINGTLSGVSMWGSLQATASWRLSGGAVWMDSRLRRDAGSTDVIGLPGLGNDPKYTLQLRSSFDIAPDFEIDVAARHVGKLPDPAVPAYTAVDARASWHPSKDIEVSLAMRNLFDSRHAEFGAAATRSELEREAFLKLVWRFN